MLQRHDDTAEHGQKGMYLYPSSDSRKNEKKNLRYVSGKIEGNNVKS